MEWKIGQNIDRGFSRKLITTLGVVGAAATLLYTDHGVSAQGYSPERQLVAPSPSPFMPVFSPRHDEVEALSIGEGTALQKRLHAGYKQDAKKISSNAEMVSAFTGIHGMTKEQVEESLEIYYPMYRMAEYKSSLDGDEGIPWSLFAVLHADETEFSTNANPGASGYVGAFQRDDEYYTNNEVREAFAGFGFVYDPRQRYQSAIGTAASNDAAELFWVVEYLSRNAALRYPDQSRAVGARNVVEHNYSAYGGFRVRLFDRIQRIRQDNKLP